MSNSETNRRLGSYELGDILGRGGMGVVHRARHVNTNRVVALKTISEHHFDDRELFRKRFDREVKIATGLAHPHIVPIYDYGHEKDTAYFVMRFLEGGSLETYLRTLVLSPGEVRRMFAQIASALAYAHGQRVIHRDLKPGNVLLDNGTPPNAYLADFGIAKSIDQSTLTKTGEVIGAPAYIAPEIWHGQEASHQSDIYALGITLFKMLTSQLPFKTNPPAAIVAEHLNTLPPNPRSLRSELPEAINEIIQRALAKEPIDRYGSVDDFLQEVDEVLLDVTPRTRPPLTVREPLANSEEESIKATRKVEPRLFPLPMLEWRDIPAGIVTIDNKQYTVTPFRISRYPVTNAQFQAFIEDSDGYSSLEWWAFSDAARDWHKENPQEALGRFPVEKRPREKVCWFEAMAFCRWLRSKIHLPIALPSEAQWQRAAQGDRSWIYPWGNRFDHARCNTDESRLRQTTDVDLYRLGASPFGVFDMSGKVWEWCLSTFHGGDDRLDGDWQRVVRGGSWGTPQDQATTIFRSGLKPSNRSQYGGFRIVILLED